MTTKKQQTPLQKLIEYLEDGLNEGCAYSQALRFAKSLLPEEKQMVINSFDVGESDGQNMAKYSDHYKFETGEQYFNETFKP